MSDSVRPQRRQPTRLPRPWDSPGKNTGVGCCHFLLQCMKVKSESEVAQSCLTLTPFLCCGLSPDISCLGYRSDLATFWEVDRVSRDLEGMAISQIEGANCLSFVLPASATDVKKMTRAKTAKASSKKCCKFDGCQQGKCSNPGCHKCITEQRI